MLEWLKMLAWVATVALSLGGISQLDPPAPGPQQSAAQEQQPAQEKSAANYISDPLFFNCHTAGLNHPNGETETRCEYSQPPIDRWARGLAVTTVIVGMITLGVLVLQWLTYRRQAHIMQSGLASTEKAANAAKTNADAAIMSLRPWLSCRVRIAGPLIFNADGDAVFKLKIIIKNVGKTPALSVTNSFYNLTLNSAKHEHSILGVERLKALNRAMPIKAQMVIVPGNFPLTDSPGRVLFPNETWIERVIIPIRHAEIEKACEGMPTKNFWPELSGLVTYTYNLAQIMADTGFVFSITKDGQPFQLGEVVPVEQIRIEPHRMWGVSVS